MKNYVLLLKNEDILRKLSTIQLISYFGAWFSNVAIYTLLIHMHVNADVIALVAALNFLPGVLQAPFSGALIDKIAPKKLMLFLLSVEIISTLLLLLIQEHSLLWLLYLLVFIRMGASSFYFTTEMALLPKVLNHDILKQANEIHSIIWSFSYTVGMAVSGFVVYIFGVQAAFILDAMLFFIALLLLNGIEIDKVFIKSSASFWKMMGQTFGYLKKKKEIIHLMLLHSLVGFTSYDAIVALMVESYYSKVIAVALALGLLNAFRALGLVIGPLFFGKWVNDKRLFYIYILQGLAIVFWVIVVKNFYLSLVASIFVGLFTTTLWSYSYTLLQIKTEKTFYGRIVAYNDMVFLAVASLTAFITGELAKEGIALQMILFYLAMAFFLSAIYYKWIYHRYLEKSK